MRFIKKIEDKLNRFKEVEAALQDPKYLGDQNQLKSLGREYRELEKIKSVYEAYQKNEDEFQEAKKMLEQKEMSLDIVAMVSEEVALLEEKRGRLIHEMESLLIQEDPMLCKNTLLEIRAGTGGLEAALFAGDLFRMYSKYADRSGFKIEVLSSSPGDAGGFKEIIASVTGQGAYGRFKFESGTHRVQRVPVTEAQGRIHTSAVTVAILPEAEEVDVEIKPEDIKIDVFRSGGPGGQSVNTTDSAVRITHIPTGLVVSCQDEKSQLKNKQKGLKILRARLFEKIVNERNAEISKQRKEQVGSGDRSEKIRTYNFPDRRVTDHRIGLTLYNLEAILDGEIDKLVDGLYEAELAGL